MSLVQVHLFLAAVIFTMVGADSKVLTVHATDSAGAGRASKYKRALSKEGIHREKAQREAYGAEPQTPLVKSGDEAPVQSQSQILAEYDKFDVGAVDQSIAQLKSALAKYAKQAKLHKKDLATLEKEKHKGDMDERHDEKELVDEKEALMKDVSEEDAVVARAKALLRQKLLKSKLRAIVVAKVMSKAAEGQVIGNGHMVVDGKVATHAQQREQHHESHRHEVIATRHRAVALTSRAEDAADALVAELKKIDV